MKISMFQKWTKPWETTDIIDKQIMICINLNYLNKSNLILNKYSISQT